MIDEDVELVKASLKARRVDERAAQAARAFERIAELFSENERLIERAKEIHAEMAAIMASIPPPEDAS